MRYDYVPVPLTFLSVDEESSDVCVEQFPAKDGFTDIESANNVSKKANVFITFPLYVKFYERV